MRDTSMRSSDSATEYVLPHSAATGLGVVYNPHLDTWSIRENDVNYYFRFGHIKLTSDLVKLFKIFMAGILQSSHIRTAENNHRFLSALLLWIAERNPVAQEVTEAHLIGYRESLPAKWLHHSSRVHALARAWAKRGLPGFSPGALAYAKEAKKHHPPKATAVTLRCPKQGALSDLEYDSLYSALHDAYAANKIRLDLYVLCVLNGAYGQRPEQWSWLQLGDLRKDTDANGKVAWLISIPRAKQRTDRPRAQLSERALDPEIALLVLAQAHFVQARARAAGMLHPEQAPLFPLENCAVEISTATPPQKCARYVIAQRISHTLSGLGVRSERTGQALRVNALRSRRTVGTRAAVAGKSLEHIAELLDHTNAASSLVYIELRDQLIANLDKKLAMELAPLAQAFKGVLATQENPTGVARRVYGVAIEGEAPANIGGCGKHGFCSLSQPIACYTCRLFQPWEDGPHEAVLDSLIDRRSRVATSGSPVVAMSLDRTIAACAEVVRQCGERASLSEGLHHG